MKNLFLIFSFTIINLFAVEKITAVMPSNFPPYYETDKKGNPTGFAVELLNTIAKNENIEVKYIIKNNFDDVNSVFVEKKS